VSAVDPGRARPLVALLVAALVAVAGCGGDGGGSSTAVPVVGGPSASSSAGRDPVPPVGFAAITIVVTQPDGSTEEFCLWVADTPELRSRGLMGVTDPDLGGRPGMVFTYDADTTTGYWMRDTPLPLTIAYLGADGSVVSTADMDPCPAEASTCPSYPPDGPFRFAVEVPQGSLEELGITADSRVTLGDAC
jgi:uncharacterized membrane protein (UPF0127 family)